MKEMNRIDTTNDKSNQEQSEEYDNKEVQIEKNFFIKTRLRDKKLLKGWIKKLMTNSNYY